MQAPREMHFEHADPAALDEPLLMPSDEAINSSQQPFMRDANKVGRNDPCPCGSGLKFKQCHGKIS